LTDIQTDRETERQTDRYRDKTNNNPTNAKLPKKKSAQKLINRNNETGKLCHKQRTYSSLRYNLIADISLISTNSFWLRHAKIEKPADLATTDELITN